MSVFDKTHRDPVDTTAAMMFSTGNKAPEQKVFSKQLLHTETCPPILTAEDVRRILNMDDLTGKRIGRLQVVGMSRDVRKRWVVRCDCGAFEMRSARSIRNPENRGDRCIKCRAVAGFKRHHHWFITGRELDIRDL